MIKNIFEIENFSKNEEIVEILEKNENIKIEKIISTGQTTDWMIQDEDEFVFLVQGNAEIEFEIEDKSVEFQNIKNKKIKKVKLTKGDTIIIKSGEKHRVSYTSIEPYCIWFCVFYK